MSSSRGETIANPQAEREVMEDLAIFKCGMCGYPVLPSWKFCPDCGAMLAWKEMLR